MNNFEIIDDNGKKHTFKVLKKNKERRRLLSKIQLEIADLEKELDKVEDDNELLWNLQDEITDKYAESIAILLDTKDKESTAKLIANNEDVEEISIKYVSIIFGTDEEILKKGMKAQQLKAMEQA